MGQAIGFFLILAYALLAEGVMDTFGVLAFFAITAVTMTISGICIMWDR